MIEEQIDDETAPRGSLDLAGAVLGGLALAAALGLGLDMLPWLAAALPMLALGALMPRVPSDRWWRLLVALAQAQPHPGGRQSSRGRAAPLTTARR